MVSSDLLWTTLTHTMGVRLGLGFSAVLVEEGC